MFAALASVSGQEKQTLTTIAYSSGNSVVLTASNGKPIKTFKLPIPVGEFSIAPDQKSIALIPTHAKNKYGAKMYLFSVTTGKLTTIPLQPVDKGAGAGEVYSEPRFSPDGKKLLFVTHAQADGDIIEGSGPLAILDLKTLQAKPLQPKTQIDGSADFLSRPMWDLKGRQILVNIEDTLAVIDVQANSIRRLDHEVLDNFLDWSTGIGWIGTNCILYEMGTARTSADSSFFVLDLKTGKHFPSGQVPGLSKTDLRGLVSFTFPFALIKKNDRFVLTTSERTDSLSLPASATVQLISKPDEEGIQDECK